MGKTAVRKLSQPSRRDRLREEAREIKEHLDQLRADFYRRDAERERRRNARRRSGS